MTYKDQFTPHNTNASQLSSPEMYTTNDGFFLWSPSESDHAYVSFVYGLYFASDGIICGAQKNSPN